MPSSIAEILMEQGRARADHRRRSGERWGSLVSQLGEIPVRILADRQQARAQQASAQRQAAMDQRAEREIALKEAAGEREAAAARTKDDEIARGRMADEAGRQAVTQWIDTHEPTIGKDAADRMRAIAQMPGGVQHLVTSLSQAPAPYTLSPGQQRRGPDNQIVAENPVAERPEPNPTESSLAMAAAQGNPSAIKALEILRRQQAASRAPERNPLDSQTEWAIPRGETEARLMTKSEIQRTGAKRPAGADKPSSGQQKRVLNFFNRAAQADKDLEQLEPEIASMGLAGQARQALVPNVLQSERGQLYTQAQRAFTEARLRKDSGAAIPEQEFANDRKTYFVQPGDTPATIAQKRRARAAMLASLGFESGQALGEFLGDAEEAARVIDGYKRRSSSTTDPGVRQPTEGETKPIPGYPGTEQTFKNGKWIRTK